MDNLAVVGDLNKRTPNQGIICKQDNKDIRNSLGACIKERAGESAIKVTWTKGHATDEHITSGKKNHEEKARNKSADVLATKGISMNKLD